MRSPASETGVFVVVPAYNEARTVRDVVDRLAASYENVVVVDDGSTDGSAEQLVGSRAFVLRHWVNRGQGAALRTGIEFSLMQGAEIVVTFDADGQHEVGDVERLVEPIRAGTADVTLGSRFLGSSPGIPRGRRLVLKAGILFTRMISTIRVTDVHNGLRAFSREAAGSLRIRLDRMAHASEILDLIRAAGWRWREVPVTIRYSPDSLEKGQSSWNAIHLVLPILLERLRR